MTKERKRPEQPKAGISNALETVGWLGGAIPGIPVFYHYAPPYFPSAWVVCPILGAAFFLWGYSPRKRHRARVTRVVALLATSIFLLALYGVTLHYCTVVPPGNREGNRRQIGFSMSNWSLTERARDTVARLARDVDHIEVSTPNQLMLIFGVWGGQGREEEIWHWWSITIAGILLLSLFVLAVGSWAYGVANLVRYVQNRKLH